MTAYSKQIKLIDPHLSHYNSSPTTLMDCPNCGSKEHSVNELDSSVCCTQCGTIVEGPYLVSHDFHVVHKKSTKKEDKVSS